MENKRSEADKIIYAKYPVNSNIPTLPFWVLHRLLRMNLFRILVVA